MKPVRTPRKRPQQRRSQALVEAILDAAAELFCADGVESTTTNAIAARAGVSIGSFYQYFANKVALLEALRERHVRRLWEKISAACDEVGARPLPSALRSIIAQTCAYNARHVALLAIIHRELPIHSHNSERLMLAQAALHQKMRAFFESHRSSIKVNIDQALFMIPALGRGIFTSAAVEQPELVQQDQFVDDMVSAMLGYLT